MARVTLGGRELQGLEVAQPAASVRLLIPFPDEALVIPEWTGNEFLMDDGRRPLIRTFTPRHLRPDVFEIDLDIVIHEYGATSRWVGRAVPGDPAAVSGTARGYDIAHDATAFVLAGDETAIPAICQLVEAIPDGQPIQTIIETSSPEARLELPDHATLTETWVTMNAGDLPGAELVPALAAAAIPSGARVWAAGEAAAMHRIRKHLFDERDLSRREVTVRGYWKHGR